MGENNMLCFYFIKDKRNMGSFSGLEAGARDAWMADSCTGPCNHLTGVFREKQSIDLDRRCYEMHLGNINIYDQLYIKRTE